MKVLGFLMVSMVSTAAFAGGSISKEDALVQVCNESKRICTIANHLNLDPVGIGVRLRSGERIMPFEFGGSIEGQQVEVKFQRDAAGTLEITLR